MTYLPTDKIRVFVSSRLDECDAERESAKNVINSLGHQPVMFEAAGARPYPPRSVYLQGLEESQIFVGIYREGYGYIAEGMDISGLEDEYRYSRSLGIPKLLYVLRDGKMEQKLKTLVDGFTGPNVTVGYFQETSDLTGIIRRDLVALVSDYFNRGRSITQSSPTHPGVIADALVPPNRRLRRQNIEAELDMQLEDNPVALVTGPLGSGKTVFLSALANVRGWAFVDCGEKPPLEVLADVANAVRALLDLPVKAFLLPEEAQSALQAAWEASRSVTLVLDDVRNQETFDQIHQVARVSNSHRLIISSREDISTAGNKYQIPPLGFEETREFVRMNRDKPLIAGELVEIHTASKGNPLYLRYYLSGEPGEYANDLAEYETRTWGSLTPNAQEVLIYLAWSDRWLSLDDLAHLVTGNTGSTEQLAGTLDSASSLLAQSDRGYSIFHPHAKKTIQNLTRRSQPRLQFYIQRLSKWFFESRDYVSAFSSLSSSGLSVPPDLLEMAARQASVKGDVHTAIKILEIQVELAKSSSDNTRERDLTLYLAQMMSLSKRTDDALRLIDRAANMEADTDPPFDIYEIRATMCALGRGDRQAFEQLLSNKEQYLKDENLWDAARISLDLGVYYTRQNDLNKAADEAKFAMEIYKEFKNDYCFRVARANYLSAISAFPERATETDKLIKEMEAEIEQGPRERLILCNVLARRARERGDISDAKAYSVEAIAIAREIGDNSSVCNNLMNLGNSYRDEENWDSAIAQYEAADRLACESNLVLAEAAVQDHLATLFNKKGDEERAIHHANYAISVARGVSFNIESSSTQELAIAYEQLNKIDDARDAWLRYASLEIEQTNDVESGSDGFVRAVSLIASQGDIRAYIAAYCQLFDVQPSKSKDLFLGERLVYDLLDIFKNISLPCTFEAAVHHTQIMFADIPDAMVRRVYFVAMRQLFSESSFNTNSLKRLRIALALSMAVPRELLGLADMVDVGEMISRWHVNISFRAKPDGAAHWTIEILFGKPIIVSIIQIDDRPDVSMVTLCLILVLVAFSPDIFEDVLSEVQPPRDGVNIQVCNFGEAKELFSLEKIGIVSEPDGCAVTRAIHVASDAKMPILVVTSDTLTKEWLPRSGSVNYGQSLFAQVLVEIIFHLQAGEIDVETLYPKVFQVIRKTIV